MRGVINKEWFFRFAGPERLNEAICGFLAGSVVIFICTHIGAIEAFFEGFHAGNERIALFAQMKCFIAARSHGFGPKGVIMTRRMEQRTSRQDHGAARRADRGDHRTRRVGVRERQAACYQSIEVRGLDVRIAQCSDAIRPENHRQE